MKNFFFNTLSKYGKNIALIDENENSYSYKDLNLMVNEYSKSLKNYNLAFLIANNTLGFIVSYLSLLRSNVLVVLLDRQIKKENLIRLLNLYQPDIIVRTSVDNLPIHNLRCVKNEKNLGIYLFNENKKIINKKIAQLISTSGTTGSEKFVKQSFEALDDNIKKISNFLKISNEDITITTMDPHYTYALSIINTHIYKGATILLNNSSFFEKKFWEKFKKYKINTFGGVPFHYEILKRLRFHEKDIKNLKYITQAGGKINDLVLDYFIATSEKKNFKFIVMYGQTEAISRISILDYKFLKKYKGSVGKPLRGYKIWINKKNDLDPKKNGGIIFSGKNIMSGYSQNLKDLKKIENIKKHDTGDIGYINNKGFIFITGRKKRYIKFYGHRINLDDIEKMINLKKTICACEEINNKIYLFLLKDINSDFIFNKYLKNIFYSKKNINFFPIKEIPKNRNNKIDYKKLIKFLK